MDAIKELVRLDLTAVVLGIFVLMSGVIAIYNIAGKFSEIIGKPLRWVKRKNTDHEAIVRLEGKIREYADNRVSDRKQSFSIQKELVDAQKKISDSVDDISRKIDELRDNTNARFAENEEKENKRIRAELKNSISELYRYYHSEGKINDIELEALEDLIEEYEAAQGENSFVHSVVQKEMYTWEKVERV